jgi:uncharacterized membrane protein
VKITHLLAIAAVVLNVAGNYCLSVGMKQTGELVSVSPLDYLRVLINPWVAIGVGLLFGWLIAQLSLLSWADLTWVLPITALGYALPAVLGAVLLHEHVHPARWAGVTLIVAGVGCVIRTIPRSHRPQGELG